MLILGPHRFPVHTATFRPVESVSEVDGWDFDIRTGPPLDHCADEDEQWFFGEGVRLYTEGDPVPLPVREDLTGYTLRVKPPHDPDTGEVYFTVYVRSHEDVSDLVLHLVERADARYRVQATARCHHVYRAEPMPLTLDTWLTRLPNRLA